MLIRSTVFGIVMVGSIVIHWNGNEQDCLKFWVQCNKHGKQTTNGAVRFYFL